MPTLLVNLLRDKTTISKCFLLTTACVKQNLLAVLQYTLKLKLKPHALGVVSDRNLFWQLIISIPQAKAQEKLAILLKTYAQFNSNYVLPEENDRPCGKETFVPERL